MKPLMLRTLMMLIGPGLLLSLYGCAGVYSQPYSYGGYGNRYPNGYPYSRQNRYGYSQSYGYPGQGYGYPQYPNSTYSYPAYYSHHRHGDDDDDQGEHRYYERQHDRD